MLCDFRENRARGRTKDFVRAKSTYLPSSLILVSAMIVFLGKPFHKELLEAEYHSGRDSFTVAPNQIPEPPSVQPSGSYEDNSSATTPQTAVIEAQLAEVQILSGGREIRQQRIADLYLLIAKIDQSQGIQRATVIETHVSPPDTRTAQLKNELDALQARTERLQQRLN